MSRKRWMILGAALLALVAVVVGVRLWLFADLPGVDDLTAGLHRPSIRIEDRNGRLLYEVIGEESGRHFPIPLDDVPQACIDATIATEDANFYRNPGVDLKAIVRAVWINLRGGEILSGGSTVTQQVARNIVLGPEEAAERTLTRKLRESILAWRLARRYSKDHILSLYLNQTDYGNLSFGIDAAARGYFNKSVDQLGLAECALLAGLPQAPGVYDPLTDPDAAQGRQRVVLDLMVRQGFVQAEEAELARRQELRFAAERYSIDAPHFVMAVYRQLEDVLLPETLYGGGLTVRTTLDLDWQNAAEHIARRQLDLLNSPLPGDPPHNAKNAALVALDPYTGQVLVMLGSTDYFDIESSGAVNMALALRQPGSTLKPFTYAAAFDPKRADSWTPATMILDVRTAFVTKEGYAYTPVNYDHREHGPVLAREALASSYNIPAVIALKTIGVGSLLRVLGQLGVTTLNNPEDVDLSLTLGGGEVRLLELTAAYAALANGGTGVQPVLILDVTNGAGQVVYQRHSGLSQPVLDERVAWLISDILSDNNARAPGFTTHSILQIGRPAAVKTGTTTDFRDNWTVGYTPNLVVGVWVGNADNSPMINISGVSGAGPIWHQFMRVVLRGQPELSFEQPADLVQVEVCSLSGLLPGNVCPYTRREWFIPGTQPATTDTFYVRVAVDALTGLPADDSTPLDRTVERVYLNLPPQAHDWARSQDLPLLPGNLADRGETVPLNELLIVSPEPQTIYQLDPTLPPDAQRIRVVAVGPPGLRDATISIDGQPLVTVAAPPFEVYWILEVGEHVVSAQGTTAAGEVIKSTAVTFRVNLPP